MLYPVVVKPKHTIWELATVEDSLLQEKRTFRRRLSARISRNLFVSSRTLVRGALSTAVLGNFTFISLITPILAPRRYGLLRDALNRAFFPVPRTELSLMRNDAESQHADEGLLVGFAIQEKADRVAGVLVPAGLTKDFARIVVTFGHGSTSLINPHESAHDCGACGGRRGGIVEDDVVAASVLLNTGRLCGRTRPTTPGNSGFTKSRSQRRDGSRCLVAGRGGMVSCKLRTRVCPDGAGMFSHASSATAIAAGPE